MYLSIKRVSLVYFFRVLHPIYPRVHFPGTIVFCQIIFKWLLRSLKPLYKSCSNLTKMEYIFILVLLIISLYLSDKFTNTF